jgi:hypothetical protein
MIGCRGKFWYEFRTAYFDTLDFTRLSIDDALR